MVPCLNEGQQSEPATRVGERGMDRHPPIWRNAAESHVSLQRDNRKASCMGMKFRRAGRTFLLRVRGKR
jgi:hypothetical protein